MKDLILKSFAYKAFIEIKDSLMAKVYALFFVKEYRHRVAACVFIFALTLYFLLDTFIINGSKLSVGGIMALSMLVTTAVGLIAFYRRSEKKKAAKKPPKGAQKK